MSLTPRSAEHGVLPIREGASSWLTHAEGMVGTPAFMAPEQVEGRALDGRADLYALGGVAFWLLTGKLVFEREHAFAQLLAQLQEPLPNLRELVPAEVPEALLQLIAACLAKQPEQRPSDARTLGRALRAIAFPPERAWTDERAEAWWSVYQPRPSEHPPEAAPRELARGVTVGRG